MRISDWSSDVCSSDLLPITLAVEISRAGTAEAQDLLLDAYDSGKLRGKKLAAVRRLLDMRLRSGHKGLQSARLGRRGGKRKLTPSDLMETYQREAEKKRQIGRATGRDRGWQ